MELSQNGIAFLDDQETVTAPTPTISTSHPFMKYLRSLHFYINHFTWKEDCVIVIAISRPNSIFLRIPNVKSRFLITTTRHPNHILVSNLAESSKELIERTLTTETCLPLVPATTAYDVSAKQLDVSKTSELSDGISTVDLCSNANS